MLSPPGYSPTPPPGDKPSLTGGATDSNPPLARDGRESFTVGSWIFLRLLAIIHLIAFASFWAQLEGLVGPNGLLPATRYFAAVHEQIGAAAYLRLPSLCWVFGAGWFLPVLCAAGVAASVLLFAGLAPAACLVFLWAAYLSVCAAGQIFFNFQWDALLLEATLLALFVAPRTWLPLWRRQEPRPLGRYLLGWLLFRLMFLAGVVKLASGDSSWRDLTALTFHYETQPLPTPLAWYAHQLPAGWHRATCAGMFVLELIVPFFLFAPRGLRHRAALLLAGLMVAVALTGNYTFFNLLAIALCLLSLDDAFWARVLQVKTGVLDRAGDSFDNSNRTWRGKAATLAGILVFTCTGVQTLAVFLPALSSSPAISSITHAVAPFRSFNNYGLFAVMTRPRPELIFEGSDDLREWRAYEFPHKPGDLQRRPTWVAPHQPRLDWQLWFAALGAPQHNPWVLAVCEHLLRGSAPVLALLQSNPFPTKPPRHVRVIRYVYHFTDAATRTRTGQWWRRTPIDVYVAPASLRN